MVTLLCYLLMPYVITIECIPLIGPCYLSALSSMDTVLSNYGLFGIDKTEFSYRHIVSIRDYHQRCVHV